MNELRKLLPLLCSVLAFSAILAGCGGGGGGGSSASAATFCSDLNKYRSAISNLVAADQGSGAPPSKSSIATGAGDLQTMANAAPSDIKPSATTLESAFRQWANNGDDSALRTSASASADRKLLAWHQANCK
jgi:hypothetical protein